MAAALICLISLPLLSLAGVAMVKVLDQVTRDRQRKVYRLNFPADLDAERVTAWLRSISGTLRTSKLSGMFSGSPSIVLEVWASNSGIVHRLRIPWQYEAFIRPRLESLVPGIRMTPEEEFPTRVWVHALEAGLKETHRQLHIYNAADVSTSILTNFGSLQENETVMMQWVIAPALPQHKPLHDTAASKPNPRSWREAILGTATHNRDEIEDKRGKLDEPNMMAVLRVGAVANTPVRAQFMVRGLISSLDATRGPATKFYRRFVSGHELQQRIERGASPLNWPAKLSAPELTAVAGWPLGNPMVSGLPAAVSRRLPPPESVPRVGRVIGESNFSGRERKVAVSWQEARKHVHVLGGTGVGKTTLLANMARQDILAGHGLVLIESKGDLFNQVLNYIPKERINDVIVLDVNDAEHPVGFNILQQGPRANIVDELINLFNALYPAHTSLWLQQMLNYGLSTLVLDKNATFTDLLSILSPAADEVDWRDNLVRSVTDPQVRRFWQEFDNRTRTQQDQRLEPLSTRIWPLTRSKLVNILGQSKSSFYMDDVIKDSSILLVNLSGVEQASATIMGTMLVNSLWQAVKRNPSEQRSTFLYLDEFHHFVNIPVDIEQMLVEARSMGLGMVLAHQYLDQLTAKNMEEAIMSNARTKVAFQLGSSDARSMANNFGNAVSPDDFQHLAKYEAISRVSTGEGISRPLTLSTLAPEPGFGLAGQVKYASRGKYSRSIHEVQDEILARRSADNVPQRRTRAKPAAPGWGL